MNTLRKIKAFLLFPVLPIIVVFFYPVNLFIVHPICLESTVERHLSAKNLSGEIKKIELHRQSLLNTESIVVVQFKDNPYTYIYTKDVFSTKLKVEIIDETAYVINLDLQDLAYKNKKKSIEQYCIYSKSDFLADAYTLKSNSYHSSP